MSIHKNMYGSFNSIFYVSSVTYTPEINKGISMTTSTLWTISRGRRLGHMQLKEHS